MQGPRYLIKLTIETMIKRWIERATKPIKLMYFIAVFAFWYGKSGYFYVRSSGVGKQSSKYLEP